ncbi:type I glyceraldehyde-3-phosphate dehydrogenase [Phaeocystidibacter marisrubri]|uniref:Type I glyceraldehyde-3-phosphate dehydrogenase n=1 Tax=Phaeocystidibacter marisrubri TaxID=1577780 RepID=A0A6L3ZGX1_9FLAO|nr:type I glyceraldehyde-3-phosphate dehydrogenase [Phaeocystidibacter marisrubri]KAB2817266.1 type I glyceraldehyde-3-phosphate dehydrogenase [Phaeocystidibacter marisrubri]
MIRVGINGFGRIGRMFLRISEASNAIRVVQINDLADGPTLAHLLKYDSVHGRFPGEVDFADSQIQVNGRPIRLSSSSTPAEIEWKDVDVVLESTGKFKTRPDLEHHLRGHVKKVVLSAPPADAEVPMVVLGINDELLTTHPSIVSNASCTTNCAAPMIKVIRENFGVEHAYITTVHSFTSDQRLHDAPHKDLRRARAATLSMVPTTTGAAKALSKVFPDLEGKMGGCGIRVPVPDGSLTDITFTVKSDTTVEEVNAAFKKASQNELKGFLGYTADPIVSADIVGLKESCLFDEQLTSVLGKQVKVVGWYDNEVGYSNRLHDLISRISN